MYQQKQHEHVLSVFLISLMCIWHLKKKASVGIVIDFKRQEVQ